MMVKVMKTRQRMSARKGEDLVIGQERPPWFRWSAGINLTMCATDNLSLRPAHLELVKYYYVAYLIGKYSHCKR